MSMTKTVNTRSWHARLTDNYRWKKMRKWEQKQSSLLHDVGVDIGPYVETTCSYIRAVLWCLLPYTIWLIVAILIGWLIGINVIGAYYDSGNVPAGLTLAIDQYGKLAVHVVAIVIGATFVASVLAMVLAIMFIAYLISTTIIKPIANSIKAFFSRKEQRRLLANQTDDDVLHDQKWSMSSALVDMHNKVCKRIKFE